MTLAVQFFVMALIFAFLASACSSAEEQKPAPDVSLPPPSQREEQPDVEQGYPPCSKREHVELEGGVVFDLPLPCNKWPVARDLGDPQQ